MLTCNLYVCGWKVEVWELPNRKQGEKMPSPKRDDNYEKQLWQRSRTQPLAAATAPESLAETEADFFLLLLLFTFCISNFHSTLIVETLDWLTGGCWWKYNAKVPPYSPSTITQQSSWRTQKKDSREHFKEPKVFAVVYFRSCCLLLICGKIIMSID